MIDEQHDFLKIDFEIEFIVGKLLLKVYKYASKLSNTFLDASIKKNFLV